MSKISYIVTGVLLALALLFVVLNSIYEEIWTGFAYFVLAILALLSLFWCVWLIVQFFTTYRKELDERFEIYRAETVNRNKITLEQFSEHEADYRKSFNKSLRREKSVKWFYIIFALACAILFITSTIIL